MGLKLAGVVGSSANIWRLHISAGTIAPQVHDFCALRQNKPNFIFLANDASGGAAAGKIAGVEFIDENGGGAGAGSESVSCQDQISGRGR